jgi:molecular chaperone DnaJ
MRCYYEVLGVSRGCDEATLKSAFRKAAMEHHPDRNGGREDASVKFKEVNEAYSILSDPQKRAAYDRFGHAGVNGAGGGGPQFQDINDIFGDVFGQAFGDIFGGGRGRQNHGPQRGADLRYDLEIDLAEAYAGAEAEIEAPATFNCESCEGTGAKPGTSPTTCETCNGQGRVRAQQGFFAIERACPHCNGRGQVIKDPCGDCRGHGQVRRKRTLQVTIPAGVDDGSRIRLSGEGDAGARGGPKGDLYIFVSVRPHDLFERDGLDLLVTVPAPMCKAALGGEIEVPCLKAGDDDECRIKVAVPEGSQTGKTIRVRGKGMPSLRGPRRGDLVVELFVETPTRLNARQKELLRELADCCGEQQHPESFGFVGKAKRFWGDITGAA